MSTSIPENRPTQSNTISLLDLIAVLAKRKWLIVITTAAAAVFIVLYSIYTIRAAPGAPFNKLPNVYRPQVKVRLQDQEGSSVSSLFSGGELGILASLAGGLSSGSSSAELALELLTGNQILDELIEEFNIIRRFGIDKNPKTSARMALTSAFDAEFSATTGIMTVTFGDTDKVFATEILTSAINKLENLFDSLTLRNIDEKKQSLENILAQYEKDLDVAQQELIDFQVKNKIIDIKLQTEYQLTALSDLESQILDKETELSALREFRRADDPEVQRMSRQLELLRSRQSLLKQGRRNDPNAIDIPQNDLPELSAIYFNLMRDLEILQAIYGGLRSQYETVKIEEKDKSQRFQIIEQAEVPEMKAGPSRAKICIIVTVTAFFLSVFAAFVLEYFERVKMDPQESEKLRMIKGMLWKSHKK